MKAILIALALAGLTLGGPALANPHEFLTKAIKGDNSETRLGALAARRGQSAGVRRFGRILEQDHSRARAMTVPVARRHHVAVPGAMMPEAQTERRKLMRLRGTAFDREFARYMVNDHRKDIADFRKEARSRDPSDVRTLAHNSLPTLRKHLRIAQSLRR